jgi:transcriptional regulator with XRE-family HTH domain
MPADKENKRFGRYLYELRTKVKPKKLSQEQVGKMIGSTRQYIDAIEKHKANTSPPRYEQCIKLAEVLTNDEDIKAKFLWLAFKERIRNNWSFYQHIHTEERKLPEVARQDLPEINRRPNNKCIKCKFTIQWFTRTPVLLSNSAITSTEKAIQYYLQESKLEIENIKVSKTSVSLIITTNNTESFDELINGLKELSTRSIKNECDDFSIQSPTIWEEGYLIRSLEYPVEVVSKKKEKVVTVNV